VFLLGRKSGHGGERRNRVFVAVLKGFRTGRKDGPGIVSSSIARKHGSIVGRFEGFGTGGVCGLHRIHGPGIVSPSPAKAILEGLITDGVRSLDRTRDEGILRVRE